MGNPTIRPSWQGTAGPLAGVRELLGVHAPDRRFAGTRRGSASREREERRHQEVTRLADALSRARPRTDRTPPHPVEPVDASPLVDYSAFRVLEDRRIVDLREWDLDSGAVTMTRCQP